jgi:hypothetical protein
MSRWLIYQEFGEEMDVELVLKRKVTKLVKTWAPVLLLMGLLIAVDSLDSPQGVSVLSKMKLSLGGCWTHFFHEALTRVSELDHLQENWLNCGFAGFAGIATQKYHVQLPAPTTFSSNIKTVSHSFTNSVIFWTIEIHTLGYNFLRSVKNLTLDSVVLWVARVTTMYKVASFGKPGICCNDPLHLLQ